jgi:signal transduction histidine kinase
MRNEIEDRRGHVYLLVALALYAPAVTLVGSASFALFALSPQAYMVMSALPATGYVIGFNSVFVVAHLVRTGDPAATAAGPLPVAMVVVAMTAIFGSWARRVSAQNDERAVLIEQLESSRAEIARLSHEAGVTAERQRLAGEIHDTVAQGLSSVVMLVQAAAVELDRDPDRTRHHLALALDTTGTAWPRFAPWWRR